MFVNLAFLILFFLIVDIYAADVDKEMSANLRATVSHLKTSKATYNTYFFNINKTNRLLLNAQHVAQHVAQPAAQLKLAAVQLGAQLADQLADQLAAAA